MLLWAILLGLAFSSNLGKADPSPMVLSTIKSLSHQAEWLRLYQYRQVGEHFRSDVVSPEFFFSSTGRDNPEAELKEAIRIYGSMSDGLYGKMQLPAQCAFPARQKVIEKLLGHRFPTRSCPTLEKWKETLRANRVSLVYVGAYAGNPASIAGHTFIRLSSRFRDDAGREGLDLLSYSVGFTARTDSRDGRAMFMLKGLSGGYPGFYDIEPHYMKVGLYNNSESRDLWEVPLNLSSTEVDLLIDLIWEYTFNAEIPYYFIGQNCSYRVLKLLEIVRSNLSLSESFWFEVLPAETVREALRTELAEPRFKFRASVKRRLALKRAILSPPKKAQYERAKKSLIETRQVEDSTVLDALLDFWLYQNYQVQTHLPQAQRDIMEATYIQTAQWAKPSQFTASQEDIRQQYHLSPPFMGHRPRWLELGAKGGEFQPRYELSGRLGMHPSWSPDSSYQEIFHLEYLGIDLVWQEQVMRLQNLWLAKVQSLEDYLDSDRQSSWAMAIKWSKECQICEQESGAMLASGSWGWALKMGGFTGAFLPEVELGVWSSDQLTAFLAPGIRVIGRILIERWVFHGEGVWHWLQNRRDENLEARLGYMMNKNNQLFIKSDLSSLDLSWVYFF